MVRSFYSEVFTEQNLGKHFCGTKIIQIFLDKKKMLTSLKTFNNFVLKTWKDNLDLAKAELLEVSIFESYLECIMLVVRNSSCQPIVRTSYLYLLLIKRSDYIRNTLKQKIFSERNFGGTQQAGVS